MTLQEFQADIRAGIPRVLPQKQVYDPTINHAPKRKDILSEEEKMLALRNALRYFPGEMHAELLPEFAQELKAYGRIMKCMPAPLTNIRIEADKQQPS